MVFGVGGLSGAGSNSLSVSNAHTYILNFAKISTSSDEISPKVTICFNYVVYILKKFANLSHKSFAMKIASISV